MTGSDLALLARTVVHLRPQQGASRVRLRAQRSMARSWPGLARRVFTGPDPAAAAGWPPVFLPVDARAPERWPGLGELKSGTIRLLGTARDLGEPPAWEHAGAPRLWRFHLHYWDWAWGLAADPDRAAARALFARLWRSWQAAAEFGHGDAWLPYPAALRAWSWCGLHASLVAGADFEPSFVAGLAAHAGFLRRHLEFDVGGNHLIKGLKALAGLAVFFADERLLRRALHRLTRQLALQVLPDGGHYERAPAYHCQVLADLIDVADLLQAAGLAAAGELTTAIARMRGWLGAVLSPDMRVPLLNDGYPVPRELVSTLRPGPAPAFPLLVLPDTGLVRAVAGDWHLLADVGAPCPAELPAHAHADTLGCLVHVAGKPLLIDTGTSTYDAGAVRDYERSTAAHNTAEVDGANSTEVWGAFRAARRARVRGLTAGADSSGVTCKAAHDGYRRLRGRPLHQRRWSLTTAGLRVDDLVTGRGRHQVVVRWHLAPGSDVRITAEAARVAAPAETALVTTPAGTALVTTPAGTALRATPAGTALVTTPAGTFAVVVVASRPMLLATESRPVAAGFGATTEAPALACHIDAGLPVQVITVWRRAHDEAGVEVAA